MNIVYLHHSTGGVIWQGGKISLATRAMRKVSPRLAEVFGREARLPALLKEYNKSNQKNYSIREITFPKQSPYGWNNYPFDYYNIWVKNAGNTPYMEEPTLEMLTKDYQVIIFKHCFPVSNIKPDKDSSDINSDYKSVSNYKLQYMALRDKMYQFPQTKFILFTGAAQVKNKTNEEEALRSKEFFNWVINEWDKPDDNIYLWDLYSIETGGGLYMKDDFAVSPTDPHPGNDFAGQVVKLLHNRIVDIIENDGKQTNLKGEKI
jgi:hypothetical protein